MWSYQYTLHTKLEIIPMFNILHRFRTSKWWRAIGKYHKNDDKKSAVIFQFRNETIILHLYRLMINLLRVDPH